MRENNTICFRNFVACCLMFAVFVATSTIAFALPENNKSTTGELIVSGRNAGSITPFVMLNGERAFSGHTFFSSGTITTSETNNATVKLGKLGSINLAPNSSLSLSFSENKISGNLIAGQIKVYSSQGVEVKIQSANHVVANDVGQNDVFTVDVQNGMTNATAETGAVSLDNGQTTGPTQNQQQSSLYKNSYFVPLIIFGGIVAVAAIYAVTNGNNNNNNNSPVVSPIR